MSFARAVELTPDLPAFIEYFRQNSLNGIIGDVQNYNSLDADEMFHRMMLVAKQDVKQLLAGKSSTTAGQKLW